MEESSDIQTTALREEAREIFDLIASKVDEGEEYNNTSTSSITLQGFGDWYVKMRLSGSTDRKDGSTKRPTGAQEIGGNVAKKPRKPLTPTVAVEASNSASSAAGGQLMKLTAPKRNAILKSIATSLKASIKAKKWYDCGL